MIYELKAGGIDERRLVGAKLEKLAEGETGTIRGNFDVFCADFGCLGPFCGYQINRTNAIVSYICVLCAANEDKYEQLHFRDP